MLILTAIIGESTLMIPIGVHHVDVHVQGPIPIRHKGNPLTVRRPRGGPFIKVIVRKVALIPPIGVHHVDLPVPIPITPLRHEGNLFAVRGPGGGPVMKVILGESL